MQTDEKYSSSYSMSSGYNSASVPNSNDNTRIKRENSINNGKTSQQNNYSTYMSSSDLMASNFMKTSNVKHETNNNRSSFANKEQLCNEVLAMCGPSNTYQLKDHVLDIGAMCINSSRSSPNSIQKHSNHSQDLANFNSSVFNSYDNGDQALAYDNMSSINQDPDPIRITKPNTQNVIYKQEVKIKYLQPPTPPPPAPIIIREKQLPLDNPTQPPIIIRQTAPCPPTPEPLTIREKAPTPPLFGEPTIIERPIPPPAPAPRQVIIERVPAPPAKPRPIIYEKWLPYKSMKRPVIVQKIKQLPIMPAPRNVIIEYEKPKAVAIRHVIEEGVVRADPATYQITPAHGEIRYVDRITDLPIENSNILSQINYEASSNDNSSYAKYLNATSSHFSKRENNSKNTDDQFDHYDVISSANDGQEYETITTSVSESLAAKIIAEAKAAGAICSSSSFTNLKNN